MFFFNVYIRREGEMCIGGGESVRCVHQVCVCVCVCVCRAWHSIAKHSKA